VAHALLEDINLIDGMQVDRVDGEAIESVCRHTDDAAALQAADDVFDFFRLRLIRVYAQ
jgi:lactam utilization protein B